MNIQDHELEQDPPSADLLAGEYVLGVLDAARRRDAEARMASDRGFARLVADWEQRLVPLIDEIAPIAPPPHVWPRIRTSLGWASVGEDRRPGVMQSVGFWRAATVLAAAAAVAAIFIGRVPQAPTPAPAPVAVQPAPQPQPATTEEAAAKPVTPLVDDGGRTAWLATVDPVTKKVLMVPVPTGDDAEGRVAELWLIPEGEAPKSLGLLDRRKAHSLDVPDTLDYALREGSLLAVTLEPAGGAPGGVATGPIIAKGDIRQL